VSPLVSPAIARAVLWFYGHAPLSPSPDAVTVSIIAAVFYAAEANSVDTVERLRSVFPAEVEAVLAVAQGTYGIDRLKRIAGVA
jgi:hypothetical protein